MTARKLLAVGGAHIDRRGQVAGVYVPGASNPGTVTEEVGGGVFNALRNALALGVQASLLSVRGGDAAGEAVARAIAASGAADGSAVFLDRATASYTALLDGEGELIAGLADMAIYENAFPRILGRSSFRDAAAGADAILCDANLPERALARVFAAARCPVFGVAISPAKVVRFRPFLSQLACLFMNAKEAASLAAAPGDRLADTIETLVRLGLRSAVITAGAGPVTAFDAHGAFAVTPPPPRTVADVTGAGDALAGVAIASTMGGVPFRDALRAGLAAAMLTIESNSAVAGFDRAALDGALALVPEPQAVA